MKPLTELTDRELIDRITLLDIFEGQVYNSDSSLVKESSRIKKEIASEIARRVGIKMTA
jgi:hypothetical protein